MLLNFSFAVLNLSYINFILRPVKEPRMVKEMFSFPIVDYKTKAFMVSQNSAELISIVSSISHCVKF